jgi:hypothetical protein
LYYFPLSTALKKCLLAPCSPIFRSICSLYRLIEPHSTVISSHTIFSRRWLFRHQLTSPNKTYNIFGSRSGLWNLFLISPSAQYCYLHNTTWSCQSWDIQIQTNRISIRGCLDMSLL